MAVRFRATANASPPEIGSPIPLFVPPLGSAVQLADYRHKYVVSLDGQQFLVAAVTEERIPLADHGHSELEAQAIAALTLTCGAAHGADGAGAAPEPQLRGTEPAGTQQYRSPAHAARLGASVPSMYESMIAGWM